MEVIGRGAVTVVDGSHMETDAYRLRGRRPMMVSGALLHSIPSGYWFDLRATGARSARGLALRASVRPRSDAGEAARPRRRANRDRAKASEPSARRSSGKVSSPRPRQTCRSCRRRSSAAPTTSPTTRRSGSGRPRVARALAVEHDRWASTTPCSSCCRASASIRARAGTRAGSASGSRKARGPATSPSTSRSSCSASPARRSTAGRPGAPARPASYNVTYGYWEEQVGLAAGRLAVRLVNHLVRAGEGLRLPARARAADPARRAARVRPLDAGDPRRGREPRRPLHPPERPVARAARAGKVSAAHQGHDDVDHVGARGRHRGRQAADPTAAGVGRAAGAHGRGGADRRRRRRGGEADRVPRRDEAARRQPRAGCRARPHLGARRARAASRAR